MGLIEADDHWKEMWNVQLYSVKSWEMLFKTLWLLAALTSKTNAGPFSHIFARVMDLVSGTAFHLYKLNSLTKHCTLVTNRPSEL